MKYLLDTNICIYIIKKKPEIVINKFLEFPLGSIGISTITLAELQFGICKSSNPENEKEFKRIPGLKIENWTKE